MARKYLLSDVASDSDALNVDNDIARETEVIMGHSLSDERGVARKYPLSDVAGDRDALNVDNDIVRETEVIMGYASLMIVEWHVNTY